MNGLYNVALTVTEDLSTVQTALTGLFGDAKTAGLAIVVTAISCGIVFIVGKWLWGKAKQWLKSI